MTTLSVSLAERLQAAKVYDLEQPRFAGMPIFPGHRPGYFYALYRRHRDTYLPAQHGPRSSASGTLVMMEHSGTHIDALCHQARGLVMYGGLPVEGAETRGGFNQLGAESVAPLLGRRGLLHAAGRKGPLPPGYGTRPDDRGAC